MKLTKLTGFFLLILSIISGCSTMPDRPWTKAVPDKTSFVIIPEKDAKLHDALEAPYIPFLDDITSSAVSLLSRVDSTSKKPINLKGIMLYPGAKNKLETVWMTHPSADLLPSLKSHFYERFTQNKYFFEDAVVAELKMQQRTLYAAQLKKTLLLSESSLAIEDAIRAYMGSAKRADLEKISLTPSNIIMNTPSLDRWARQLTKVNYRPAIDSVLDGTKPAMLSISEMGEDQERSIQLSGEIPLSNTAPSTLVSAFSSKNAPISLDKYISSDVAAFGLFRLSPSTVLPKTLADTTSLDSTFVNDNSQYASMAQTLSSEFALLTFAKSGFLSTGEHLFVRKTKDSNKLKRQLRELADDNLIQQRDGTYLVKSSAMAQLIGSKLCSYKNFYLDVSGSAVIISKRKGLVEMISSDRKRRRTMYYESSFRDIKENLNPEISGLFVTQKDFYPFIKTFLSPNNYVNAITSKFNGISIMGRANSADNSLSLNISSYQSKESSEPYREKWIFPTGSDISGAPALANLGGSNQDEIIFATNSGHLYALAADGTVVMQSETEDDTPVGAPRVYDWYGTNQNVILLAAGNKIYGWNDNGQPLPKFPFKLSENITAPITVNDIDGDGLPNILAATADHQLHALNGRGDDISGWPVSTSAKITTPAAIRTVNDRKSVLSSSENGLYAWATDGQLLEDYPKFIDAPVNGSPYPYKNNIIANAADGHLYATGSSSLFADSLNVLQSSSGSSDIEAVYTSESPLVGTPSVKKQRISVDKKQYDEPMILTMSANGSIFLLSTDGQLRFTKNMGQPAASSFSPFVTDINSNGSQDLVALANFGRLYVWDINSGERIYSVPTSGMKHPVVSDVDGDGYKELIAQTSEGLRCWTIYGSK